MGCRLCEAIRIAYGCRREQKHWCDRRAGVAAWELAAPVQCCLCGWSLCVWACQCSLGAAVAGGATKHLLMLSLFCSWWWATFTAHALPLPLLPGYRSPCWVETASSDPVCSACRTLGHVDAICICARAKWSISVVSHVLLDLVNHKHFCGA